MYRDARTPSGMQHAAAGTPPPAPPANWRELEDQFFAGVDQERRYRCPECLDQRFVTRQKWQVSLRAWYTVAWFCSCAGGRAGEAGFWFARCYPWEGNQRVPSESMQRALERYVHAHPDRASWLYDAIEALRQKHEDARKRKLRQIQESKDAFHAKVEF